MIVLVTGSREWTKIESVAREMQKFPADTVFVHGYADGADLCCHIVGAELGFKVIPVPAHWRHNAPRWVEVYGPCPKDCKEYVGRAAGPIRNRKMLKQYNPEVVLAFHENLAESKGTADMVMIAEKAGKKVLKFSV